MQESAEEKEKEKENKRKKCTEKNV